MSVSDEVATSIPPSMMKRAESPCAAVAIVGEASQPIHVAPMHRPDLDNRQRHRNLTGDLTGYHFAGRGVARTLASCPDRWR
jgi:hypothetical protein